MRFQNSTHEVMCRKSNYKNRTFLHIFEVCASFAAQWGEVQSCAVSSYHFGGCPGSGIPISLGTDSALSCCRWTSGACWKETRCCSSSQASFGCIVREAWGGIRFRENANLKKGNCTRVGVESIFDTYLSNFKMLKISAAGKKFLPAAFYFSILIFF